MTLTPLDQNLHNDQDDREVLVRVENVSKKFCRSLKKSLRYGVQDIASELIGRKYEHVLRPDEFWSVRDVSFELRRGECLGLIGHNGAGKTTLLKMLNGLIKPDRGSIEMNGRVGALIALGTGFNPILTGRENIYVNASILGISKKEIDAKIDEIIDFAEIVDFIDTPVQSYSSGMTVRLGFAVASRLNPDVLIIDEVLAVGDIAFKLKCYNEIYRLVKNAAVVFVSHSMPQIARLCSQCLVMDKGEKILLTNNVPEGIDRYNQMIQFLGMTSMGDGLARIRKLKLNSSGGVAEEIDFENPKLNKIPLNYQDTLSLTINLDVDSSVKAIRPQINFFNVEQHIVAQCSPDVCFENEGINFSINVTLEKLPLNRGIYSMGIAIYESDTHAAAILAAFRDVIGLEISHSINLGAAPVQFIGDWKKEINM
jgi:lipopolysaccharide transport system ATP-binding protein